jgi:hypothetical protein
VVPTPRKAALRLSLFVVAVLTAAALLAGGPGWPSVDQQLAADRIVAGSALERLVRANQQVEMLQPGEAGDGLPYPAWLRVLWRKTHRMDDVNWADPTGGYPRVMGQIHAWLLAHQDEAGRVLAAFDAYGVWPAVPDQLQRHGIGQGSALARLVEDNQELWMLRPEEVKDLLPTPPWLRVAFRKAHPELTYQADDPTGGYPHVLKEVLEWMVGHQDLKSDPPVAEGSAGGGRRGASAAAAPDGQQPNGAVVGPDLKVSGPTTDRRSESDIRINYWDPQKVVAASNNISGSWQGQYWSTDGGDTWHQTLLPANGSDSFHSDPTVDWTSDGTAWSTTMGIQGSSTLRVKAYKSTDSGATWVFDGTVSGSQTSTDKQMVWIDHSATSPYKDQIYAIWHNGSPGYVNRRTAAGWQTPLQVSGSETTGTAIGSDIKTNAFGDVFAFWPDTGSRGLYVRKSTDGGASYASYVRIATAYDSYDIGVPSFNNRRALIYVAGGAYRTASKNLVYATWTDLTGTSNCDSASEEPGSNVSSQCKTRVWFARSTNGGTTWQPPVMLNNQATLNDQFNQWLVVDESTGALAVIYYDTVGDSGRKKTDIYYQSSFDDGLTWSAAARVTTAMTDETSGSYDSGNQYGDYNGLSGWAGKFLPSWTDRRTSTGPEEIWTAGITDLMCTRPGTPTIGSVTVPGDNALTVSWSNGSPAAATFKIYRAVGSCASPGPFAAIAGSVSGTSYTDTTVQGGIPYAYKVAGLDATGFCESEQASGCVSATATGVCSAPPVFAGIGAVTAPANATCTLDLSWTAATSFCGGAVLYNIYRGTTAGFVPEPGNRIAAGISGTTYSDAGSLQYGTTYHYVVRAVDAGNAAEDLNSVHAAGSPHGTVTTGTWLDDLEPGADTGWTHAAAAGSDDWALSTASSHSPTHAWAASDPSTVTDKWLVIPASNLAATSVLTFWHSYDFEVGSGTTGYDGGVIEISVNGGTTWADLGAAITAGGYTHTISSSYSNPLAGRQAWSGAKTAFSQVSVNLAAYAGAGRLIRWRMGCDSSSAKGPWYIDDIQITDTQVFGSCVPGGGLPLLSVGKAGTGSGTVTSTPAGIDCGATCSASFDPGQSVSLAAAAGAGSTFTGWSGACTGTGACVLTMDGNTSVTATFAVIQHTLSVSKTGTGSGTLASTPAGIDCGATCSAGFEAGALVTLAPTPAVGSAFAGWSGACTGTGACQVTMDAAKAVTAAFTLIPRTLTVARAGNGSGTVTSTPAGVDCGATCGFAFDHGTLVTLTPQAGGGSQFLSWSGACTGSGACQITMVADASVTATFSIQASAVVPVSLAVDYLPGAGLAGNGVLEPGETVGLAPTWRNNAAVAVAPTGALTNLAGPSGASYTLVDPAAAYPAVAPGGTGGCRDASEACYAVQISDPATRPLPHWDVTALETLNTGSTKTWTIHVGESFADTLPEHWAYPAIEALYHWGITTGCLATPLRFCPEQTLTRAEMAAFLVRSKHGGTFVPPDPTGSVFTDVPAAYWAAGWIEQLAADGLTKGCGTPGLFCPEDAVSRTQMAIFLLRLRHGGDYVPPPGTGSVFSDVPLDHWGVAWIEQLATEGITTGCGEGKYCPEQAVTRAEMAVFLKRCQGLQLAH